MQNHDYRAAAYAKKKKLPLDDSRVLLLAELSAVEAPSDFPAVEPLLKTLNQTGLTGGSKISVAEAMAIWRTVELARRLSPDRVEMLRA